MKFAKGERALTSNHNNWRNNRLLFDSRLESQNSKSISEKSLLVAFEITNKYNNNVENKLPTNIHTGVSPRV